MVVDSVRMLWRSNDLQQPTTMASTPDGARLVIGDNTRVHVLEVREGQVTNSVTVGREGEGPGEYRGITSVGILASDTLVAYDAGLDRVTVFSPEGDVIDTRRLATHDRYPPARAPRTLRVIEGRLLEVASQGELTPGRGTVALVSRDFHGRDAVVLEEWPGMESQVVDGTMLTGRHLLPDGTIAAVGPGGLVAEGRGQGYCVTVLRVASEEPPLRLCHDRERASTGDGIRSPDWTRIEDPDARQVFQRLHRAMVIEDHLPSYDRLLWAEDGSLWVRTMGNEMADIHPFLRRMGLEPGPSHRAWDVFDGEDGRLRRTLRLPGNFEPQAIVDTTAYGFYELPTGEIAIGAVDLGR